MPITLLALAILSPQNGMSPEELGRWFRARGEAVRRMKLPAPPLVYQPEPPRLPAVEARQVAALRRRPVPLGDPAAWASFLDLPSDATRSGVVRARLRVGTDGVPTSCSIVAGVESVLDRATCRLLLARARFEPAIGAEGGAVAADYDARLRWVPPLPGGIQRSPD